MANHQIVIHENTGATKTVAPYLGSYIAKETIALAQFASAVGLKCGLPAIQVVAILGGSFEAIEELEREALVRVHTDIGVICGVITGTDTFSIAGADLAPDTTKEDEYVALVSALGVETKAEITFSDIQNVKARLASALPAGQYTLKVCTRSGFGDEFGVKCATRKVTVA